MRVLTRRTKLAASGATIITVLGVLSAVLVIRGGFSAADCAAGQTDGPPPGWPTPNATQLANRATLDYQLSLTPPPPAPTTEIVLPPGGALSADEERTYYPEWETYLTDAQATAWPEMTHGSDWLDIRPPEAGGSVGGQAAQPDISPCY